MLRSTRRLSTFARFLLLAAGALPATFAAAQVETPAAPLAVKDIMRHPDWLGRAPETVWWSEDGSAAWFLRKREGSEVRDVWTFQVRANGEPSPPALVPPADYESVPGRRGTWSADQSARVAAWQGDIYLWRDGARRQLTRTAERDSSPFFLGGSNSVIAYQTGNTWTTHDLGRGLIGHPFELRTEDEPEEARQERDEKEGWLGEQQERLFDIVRQRTQEERQQEEFEAAIRSESTSTPDPPWYLGDDKEVGLNELSPTGEHLLVHLLPADRPKATRTEMPEWVTASGNIETREVRAKVGIPKPFDSEVLVLDRQRHEQQVLDFSGLPGITDDPLAEIRAVQQEADDDAQDDDEKEPEPRPLQIRDIQTSPDGRYAIVQAHSFDNKDRWLALIILETATVVSLHHLHDPGWINWSFNDFGWLPDSSGVWFLSEESGWSQVYRALLPTQTDDITAGSITIERLTRGDFVVSEPQLARDGRTLYYRANTNDPSVWEIWKLDLETSEATQLTNLSGDTSAYPSPDGRHLLLLSSTTNRPPELFLLRNGDTITPVTSTITEEYLAREWVEPRLVDVPSSHQKRPVRSRLYLPAADAPNRTAEGKRPAVMFVHGAGYLQNAHAGWSGYFREFMFHTLLTERGFVVLDMDYRGSAGYGRDWRTAIYRQMGHPEVEDLKDGAAWLAEHHDVDPERVGVYGGSYGGFLAFMSLFTEPDLFAAGAALRPVTDWAHYNHPYTSNILNTPEDDPEAYARSSPIEFADGLSSHLLICAPMLDDNVFFQDTVRLVQRLIELEKENWDVALYPVEAHGFRQPSSWLDEYRRILELFEENLLDSL